MIISVLDQYFQSDTMSVHFKAETTILSKSWRPGAWSSSRGEVITTQSDIENLISTLFEEITHRKDAFLEIDKPLSKVVQLGAYRIVIVTPPLSDGLEMTVVRPVARLSLDQYNLDERVIELLLRQAKGILISGAPGSGKSTFAQALVDIYQSMNKVIKTVESPRDLMVGEEIVQYSFSYGSHNEIRDILLLSRPDMTVYDEVRNREDFELYKDLRLTGIGLVWVIHATKAVDSIQRFLGTIEMGIIPQVVDTVVYMEGWEIREIYNLKLTVWLPIGMQSADLARPVVEVTSFLTGEKHYQIYSYGEQVIVMPLAELTWPDAPSHNKKEGWLRSFAEHGLSEALYRRIDAKFSLVIDSMSSITLYVAESAKGWIIGKWGSKIMQLEKDLWLSISLRSFDELQTEAVQIESIGTGKHLSIRVDVWYAYARRQVTLLLWWETIETFWADDQWVIVLDRRHHVKAALRSCKKVG